MKKASWTLPPNRYERAMSCRLPGGRAENYKQLEAMRKDVMFCMTIAATDPYLSQAAWSDNEIQKVADRLKKIRVQRARALRDAQARGWRFVYRDEANAI